MMQFYTQNIWQWRLGLEILILFPMCQIGNNEFQKNFIIHLQFIETP